MNAVVSLCHFCELHGPSVVLCTEARRRHEMPSASPEFLRQPQLHAPSGCEACWPHPIATSGFVSSDAGSSLVFLSQKRLSGEAAPLLQQACVRSLSCEVCPTREGPIFFGDVSRGHVISYTFSLRDSQARGFQRWFSLVVLMRDHLFLLNSWPFVVDVLGKIIKELQDKASVVYEKEHNDISPRALRLQMAPLGTRVGTQDTESGACTTETTSGGLQGPSLIATPVKPTRSLQELTCDTDVYLGLHEWFSWLLQAMTKRLTERMVMGLSIETAVTDVEKDEDAAKTFVTATPRCLLTPSLCSSVSVQQQEMSRASRSNSQLVGNLRNLQKVMEPEVFRILTYCVVVGRQVVVRGPRQIVTSVLKSLKVLIPSNCCPPVILAETYHSPEEARLLGLPPETVVPRSSEEVLVLDVEVGSGTDGAKQGGGGASGQWQVKVHSGGKMNYKSPTVLCRMERALANPELSESALESFFMVLKQEWMNIVKAVLQFTSIRAYPAGETERLMRALGAHPHDRPLVAYWARGLDVEGCPYSAAATEDPIGS